MRPLLSGSQGRGLVIFYVVVQGLRAEGCVSAQLGGNEVSCISCDLLCRHLAACKALLFLLSPPCSSGQLRPQLGENMKKRS